MNNLFKAVFVCCFILNFESTAQKTITSEEMKTISKGDFEIITADTYVAKDGHSYKIGDILKLGRPYNDETFTFISEYSTFGTLNGQKPQPLSIQQSGITTIIKEMGVVGNKKSGFKIGVIAKGVCGNCPSYSIDFEEAILTGEIKTATHNKPIPFVSEKQYKPVDSEDEEGKGFYIDGMESNSSRRIKATPYTPDKSFNPPTQSDFVEDDYGSVGDLTNSNRTISETPYTVSANDDFIDSSISKLKHAKDLLDAGKISKIDYDKLKKVLNKDIRDIAISKLKKAKELLDAGKISKIDYYKLQEALEKYLNI